MVVLSAALGAVLLAVMVLGVLKVDCRWRRAQMRCCRCLAHWYGRAKLCTRCGARGMTWSPQTAHPHRVPSHDWQGQLDTVELPVLDPRMVGYTRRTRGRVALERIARQPL